VFGNFIAKISGLSKNADDQKNNQGQQQYRKGQGPSEPPARLVTPLPRDAHPEERQDEDAQSQAEKLAEGQQHSPPILIELS
jgi:hypothetical protein